jgi:hypothetical protein
LKKVEAKRQDNEDTWQEQFAADVNLFLARLS